MGPGEGSVVGDLCLDRRIAIGGMAEVWSARRVGETGAPRYAVKVLLEMFARDAKLRAMFRDEAAIAQRLEHPNIIRVDAMIEQGEVLAHVMELVDGRDLRRVLQAVVKANERVPVALAVVIARETARGLAHAHAAVGSDGLPLHLVHRDVSPHNVMLDRSGRVAVLDFGVARARERVTVTTVGTVKGKLAYMAPEQMLAGEVTALVDVWALGIVLWEMLALRRAFGAVADAELVVAVTRNDVARVDQHRPDAPARLVELIARMVMREPAGRPPSMAAVVAALDDIASGLGAAATTRSLAAWASGFMESSPRRTGVLMAPQLTAPARPPTATIASAFDDSVRDGGDLADTAPADEGLPTVATSLFDQTEAVAMDLSDRTDPVPVVSSSPQRGAARMASPGYDVSPALSRLDPEDQVAPTLAHVTTRPTSDEAPTVMPGALVAPAVRRPLADAATPVTPLATPRVARAAQPEADQTRPVVLPQSADAELPAATMVPVTAPRNATAVWIVGGLLAGLSAVILLARACT